jgi:hypothetical protein
MTGSRREIAGVQRPGAPPCLWRARNDPAELAVQWFLLRIPKRIVPLCFGGGELRWSLDRQKRVGGGHMPNIAVKVKGSRRSNVVVSNLSPNLRARCQEAFNSRGVGRRAISAYLFRYFELPGSQKLSG